MDHEVDIDRELELEDDMSDHYPLHNFGTPQKRQNLLGCETEVPKKRPALSPRLRVLIPVITLYYRTHKATNRTLLRWLKTWDPYVFGTDAPPQQKQVKSTIDPVGSHASDKRGQSQHKFNDIEQMAGRIDPRDGRPAFKLILLVGSPGSGKTTLAHLLAKHVGYQVIEMNASDDRSVSVFKSRLSAVVSTTSSLNMASSDVESHFKPCCLILDEIDGAVPAAVELLAKAARAPVMRDEGRIPARRDSANSLVLRRPVICICNDLYSPSVRPLRNPGVSCLVVRLPPVELGNLVSRLYRIATKEHLPLDKILLTQLAELSDRDIRSCLNIMQFLKSSWESMPSNSQSLPKMVDLKTLMDSAGNFGSKDVQRNLFDLWKGVFTIPNDRILANWTKFRPKAAKSGSANRNQTVTRSDASITARLGYVSDLIDACPDTLLFVQGIFENYLRGRMKDASLKTARRAASWFLFHDQIIQHIHSRVDFTAYRYLSWLPAWFHLSFATPSGFFAMPAYSSSHESRKSSGLQWPTAMSELVAGESRCVAVLDQFKSNQWSVPSQTTVMDQSSRYPNSLRFLSRRNILLDSAPFVVALLSRVASSLRPVNAHMYGQLEKANLAHLASVMLNMGLDWSAQRVEETRDVEFILEPPLDSVTKFGKDESQLSSIAYTTKQFIAREIHLERMRRAELRVKSHDETTKQSDQGHPRDASKMVLLPSAIANKTISPGFPDSETPKSRIKRDFFGRPVEAKVLPVQPTDAPNTHSLVSRNVFYKFKEGFSNAVRRPALMKQFL